MNQGTQHQRFFFACLGQEVVFFFYENEKGLMKIIFMQNMAKYFFWEENFFSRDFFTQKYKICVISNPPFKKNVNLWNL